MSSMNPKDLYNIKIFDLEFFKLLGKGFTQQAAFDKLNSAFKESEGRNRYSNLSSYRVTKAKRMKNA